MQLVIFAKNTQRVINVHADFFTPIKIRNGHKTEIVLPRKKAHDLALDFYGDSLIAWELSKDGVIKEEYNMHKVRIKKEPQPQATKDVMTPTIAQLVLAGAPVAVA